MLLMVLLTAIVTRYLAHLGHYTSIFDLTYHTVITPWSLLLNLLLVQAWNTLAFADLERRRLVRQRGMGAVPVVSAVPVAGGRARRGAAWP